MAQEPKYNKPIVVKFKSNEPPKFVERQDKDYVFYGLKNDYPYYLLGLYQKSTKHSALINGKCRYIVGKGWTIDSHGVSLTQLAQYKQSLQSVNEDEESLDEVTKKIVLDWLIFGGYSIECIWNKAGSKIVGIKHVPFSGVRKNKDGTFSYTKDWYIQTPQGNTKINNQPEEAEDFTIYKPFDKDGGGVQLFYFKDYSPNIQVYPLPEYKGTISFIEIDIGIATFWNSLIKRGFTAAHIISFFTGQVPTKEQKEEIKKEIENLYGGAFSEEAGGFVLEFASDKDHASSVNTLQPTEMDKQYDLLNKTTQQEIFTGHNISNPMLFGIKTEGQLGGRTELIEANELFQNVYVTPKQQELESAMNYILEFMGFGNRLKLTQIEPIGYQFSEGIIKEFLPAEALRDMIAEKMGVDLQKYKTPTPVQVNTRFSSDKFELKSEWFSEIGESADGYEVLASHPIETGTLDENEAFVKMKYQGFAKDLTEFEAGIIDLLEKDPKTTPEVIAEVLKKKVSDVQKSIEALAKRGLIAVKGNTITVTKKGGKDLSKATIVPTEEIFVKYKYDWFPGREGSLADSRPFCRDVVSMNKVFTRDEIEKLNAKVRASEEYRQAFGDLPVDVWESRGGWYRKPGTDVSIPACRHIWSVQIARKKN